MPPPLYLTLHENALKQNSGCQLICASRLILAMFAG
jgi:hypothetical protein